MPSSEHFHTTRWTLVRASRGEDTTSQQALSELCAAYYAPVVAFIGRCGFEDSRARDLAHDFFARLLASPQMLKPERERGRFRSYLLGAVKHFVSDALDRERAVKRGGAATMETITEAGAALTDEMVLAPDREFDRQWALTVLSRVIATLHEEFCSAGKTEHFALLKPWLTGDDDTHSQAVIAERLAMNEGAVKVAIHRLRKRFRELIKAEIAQTVGSEADAREELSHLLAAM
jgi:RNA polymerase sigma-70 factor (ECF subfamily)